ncbi:hypothetical protein EVG20_g2023 [Dentipellis fragilis]|uniref:RRM domain-containing protein n=1 Tax=Dentipellis fragilis TaxID=205917 RepID=A0A4Y9ZB16_9AGAM|nr:hypothetical protein EVG20_g2023 [Dentipellis fragilis]
MDKSLDDIIATSHPKGIRRTSNRKTARQQVLGNPGTSPTARARLAANAATLVNSTKAATVAPQPADKIIVSNLPLDVNEVQVKELFHTTVGPLRDVTLHYDSAGRSKGVASVHFQRKGDGTKAYQQYNNRLIDGTSLLYRGRLLATRALDQGDTLLSTWTELGIACRLLTPLLRTLPLARRVFGAHASSLLFPSFLPPSSRGRTGRDAIPAIPFPTRHPCAQV